MQYKKAEAKEWAKGHYKGLEATILPSFTPDELALDEAGIRHDIRQLIKHGFFAAVTINETGTTFEEDKKFLQWCVDEAKGRIGVVASLRYPSLRANIEMAQYAEAIGADALFLSYPPNFRPTTLDEIYNYTAAICAATNLAVELFPAEKYDFPFPCSIPPQLLNRIADIENVVAMKNGVADMAYLDECFRLFGEKILICHPHDEMWPMLRRYPMQWSGSAPWQVWQTVDDRREINLWNMIQAGDLDDAMALYWKMDPLRKFLLNMMRGARMATGMYNFQLWKYMEGLVGHTGGELRFPRVQLLEKEKIAVKATMKAVGLNIIE